MGKNIVVHISINRNVDVERFSKCFPFVEGVKFGTGRGIRGCLSFTCDTMEELLKVRAMMFTSPLVRDINFCDKSKKVITYECGIKEQVYVPRCWNNKKYRQSA